MHSTESLSCYPPFEANVESQTIVCSHLDAKFRSFVFQVNITMPSACCKINIPMNKDELTCLCCQDLYETTEKNMSFTINHHKGNLVVESHFLRGNYFGKQFTCITKRRWSFS